jgi:RNA-binding protein YhbY
MFVAGVGKCDRCSIVNRLVETSAAQPIDSLGNILTFFRADPPKYARTVRV